MQGGLKHIHKEVICLKGSLGKGATPKFNILIIAIFPLNHYNPFLPPILTHIPHTTYSLEYKWLMFGSQRIVGSHGANLKRVNPMSMAKAMKMFR